MTKLNLGCGKQHLTGFVNLDSDEEVNPDRKHDLHDPLPFPDGSVDEVYVSHTLMYFTNDEKMAVLSECYRVMNRGAIIRVTEDNVYVKCRDEQQQKQYGHGTLVSFLKMKDMMKSAGFNGVRESEPFPEAAHHVFNDPKYPLPSGPESVYFLIAHKGSPKTERKVYFTLDDFGEEISNLDLLWKLRDYFDDFKVSLFAVPAWCGRLSWMEYVTSIGWIDLYVHGFFHKEGEELDEKTLTFLTQRYFKRGYKPPMWKMSDKMYERLRSLGFKIFLHKNDPRDGIKYNWDIRDPIPGGGDLHGYGHVYLHDYPYQDPNSLVRYVGNVLKLPKNTNFALYP